METHQLLLDNAIPNYIPLTSKFNLCFATVVVSKDLEMVLSPTMFLVKALSNIFIQSDVTWICFIPLQNQCKTHAVLKIVLHDFTHLS